MAKGSSKDELVFCPLGGVGEIGMNLALYGFGPADDRKWIMVDCGVTFPGPDLPGADLVLPDIGFIEEHADDLLGIVITHAHEDHYGALLDLWPRLRRDVWMTPFAAGLLEAKRVSEKGAPKIPVHVFHVGDRFSIGPFDIETVAVSHSIPEPCSLAITTPLGTFIHSGDWKLDPAPTLEPKTNEKRLREIGEAGVLALVCDSTNAMRKGESPSEEAVAEGLAEVVAKANRRVAVTSFASNVGRIRSIAQAAERNGRQVVVVGRSLQRVIDVAGDLGYMDGLQEFVSEDDFYDIPRENILVLCTGSQGEPRAALARLARGEMRNVELSSGDMVIYSSRVIPGNEKAILEIKNQLIEKGIEIVEDDDALIHVSGHPRRSELVRMYEWVKPETVIPVHGEAAHLVAHGELAISAGVPNAIQVRNGDMLRLAPGKPEIVDQVPVGILIKDGKILDREDAVGMRDRRRLSYVGHVAVNVVLDDRYELAGDPDLVAIGLPETDDRGDDMEELLLDAAIGAFDGIPRQRRKDLDLVQEAVRRAVRAAADSAWGKKPETTVFVTR